MKKHLITALVLSLLLVGCSGNSESNSTGKSNETADTNIEQSTQGDTQTSADTELPGVIEVLPKDRAYLTLDTPDNLVSAEIVLFDSENKEKLEQAQEDALSKYINESIGEQFTLTRLERDETKGKDFLVMSIDLDAELKFMDDSMISIVYTGMLTDKGSAHPTHLFYSLNLDTEKLEPVAFSDTYTIGEELYNVFADHSAEAMAAKWGENYLTELGSFSDVVCNAESFASGIMDGSIMYYYTENNVGLSFPLPFVLGGHIEVEVPYVQLDLYKDTPSNNSGTNVLMSNGSFKVYYETFPETPNEADYFISAVFISPETNDSTVVSVYLGTYSIREVSAGEILLADVDRDHSEEVVVRFQTSDEGSSRTLVYRLEEAMLERIAEIKAPSDIKCEYQNGKKVKLTSTLGAFSLEADISGLFDNSAFDKDGKAIGDGIATVKSINKIRLNGETLECVATLALDAIDAFDVTYKLSVKDGEYTLSPISAVPLGAN